MRKNLLCGVAGLALLVSMGCAEAAAPWPGPYVSGAGAYSSGNCVAVNSNGQVIDAGAPCATAAAPLSLTSGSSNLLVTPTPCSGTPCVLSTTFLTDPRTTTSEAIVSGDAGKLVTFNNASAIAVTLPAAGSAGFTQGWSTTAASIGAGTATITPATGSIGGSATLAIPQNTSCELTADSTTDYKISGCTALSSSNGFPITIGSTSIASSSTTTTIAGLSLTAPNIGAATGTSLVASSFVSAGAAAVFNWTGLSKMSSPADGTILFANNAASGFTRVLFGGATSSFPALNISGAGLVARLADNSANAAFTAGALSSSGVVTFSGVTTGTNADFACFAAGGVMTLQTTACTISSKRFKNQQADFTGSALSELAKLSVGVFTMKGGENPDPNFKHVQMGLYAEDVAAMDPRCAIYENDMKTPKSYRQECIIALLVKGEQELSEREMALLGLLLGTMGLIGWIILAKGKRK